MFLCPEQKGPYIFQSPLHWYSCRRRRRSLRGPSYEKCEPQETWRGSCENGAPGTNLSEYDYRWHQQRGFTGCPECHIRIILGKKNSRHLKPLMISVSISVDLMLVQSYLNANFFLWVWNGQKPPNGLREITWKILLKTREALPWSDSGELNFTDTCVHAYVRTGLLHKSDGNQRGDWAFAVLHLLLSPDRASSSVLIRLPCVSVACHQLEVSSVNSRKKASFLYTLLQCIWKLVLELKIHINLLRSCS